MSEGAVGFAVFVGLCVAVAAGAHYFLRRFFLASILSALAATALFQVIAALHLGYFDPFWPIAVLFSAPIAFGISLLVGLLLWMYWASRKKARSVDGGTSRDSPPRSHKAPA